MKSDRFVKGTLVLIAVFLGIIALKPIFKTETVQANPGGKLDFVQGLGTYSRSSANFSGWRVLLFDSRTGDLWEYRALSSVGRGDGKPIYRGTITELGKPILHNR